MVAKQFHDLPFVKLDTNQTLIMLLFLGDKFKYLAEPNGRLFPGPSAA